MDDLRPPLSPEEDARAKFLEDFAELMKTPRFRRWLWHLIEDPGWCWAYSRGADVENVHAMYFALGKREIGSLLSATAQALADELFKSMLVEAINMKHQRTLRAHSNAKKPEPQ